MKCVVGLLKFVREIDDWGLFVSVQSVPSWRGCSLIDFGGIIANGDGPFVLVFKPGITRDTVPVGLTQLCDLAVLT